MSKFTEIDVHELSRDPFEMIGKQWMLITAGDERGYNTMTASWGSMGILWNKPITNCFVRPQRHTVGYLDGNEYYTLSFFAEEYRNALSYCGKMSGRDVDKAKECGLTPVHENGYTYFAEAETVIVCRKLYKQQMDPSCILDASIDEKNYPAKDYHFHFIGEIVKVLSAK